MNPERAWLLDLDGFQRVRRWKRGASGGSSEVFVTVGWLPDGRWWVESTNEVRSWIYRAETSAAARQLAQAHADKLMAGGDWEPAIAVYEPGVVPARAAEVPQWPPGHEPGVVRPDGGTGSGGTGSMPARTNWNR